MGRTVKGRKAAVRSGAVERAPLPKMGELAELVSQLKEEEVLALVRNLIETGSPAMDILQACQTGMRMVGSMHEQGQYFIAGLIMAGEIMRQVLDLVRPVIGREKPEKNIGKVLLGTIKGDIHDIGKNLFKDLLECHGFTVMDLGVDVPPRDFVQAAADFNPDFIAVSVLITDSFPHLRELVRLFHDAAAGKPQRPFIMIGGGQVDERILRVSGSDYWAADAFAGLELCRRLVADRDGS